MERLFDFIFANLFFVIILLGGLFTFFKNLLENTKQKTPNKTDDGEEGATLRDVLKRFEETFDVPEFDMPKRTKKKDASIPVEEKVEETSVSKKSMPEEKPVETFTTLAEPSQTKEPIFVEHRQTLKEQTAAKTPYETNAHVTIQLQKKLNRTGLVESIIMKELLGPPKARKKHHRYMNR